MNIFAGDLISVGLIAVAAVLLGLFLLVPGTPFEWAAMLRGARSPTVLGDRASDPEESFEPPPDETRLL